MTKIEWARNADGSEGEAWNPIVGCSLASPGCTNCYAMKFAGTRLAHTTKYDGLTQPSKAGPVWTGKLAFNDKALLAPLGWKKPRTVFVNSMGDLFHEDCPDEWIDRVFAVMALCPQHTFQVLTKRSARMREWFNRYDAAHDHNCADMVADAVAVHRGVPGAKGGDRAPGMGWPLPNVWLGVSVEDQQRADERTPDLLATPAAIRWISAEPLLGPVKLEDYWLSTPTECERCDADSLTGGRSLQWCPIGACSDDGPQPRLDWVVVGGESGKDARPMHPDWARALRDQCAAADVHFFFKQWGEWGHADQVGSDNPALMRVQARANFEGDGPGLVHVMGDICLGRIGKKHAGRLLDGVEHNGMPEAR